jgi:Putative zincin peptidase
MFFIPAQLISLLTFPGVIVHEAAHFIFCKIYRLAIFDVCFFRFGNPAGYVIHERTTDFRASFFVAVGPFIINSGLCLLFCTAAFVPIWELKIEDPLAYFFYWLGLSIGMHAFPSTGDLQNLWAEAPAEAKRGNLLAIVSYPLIGVLYIANYARVVWADLGYAILIGILLPLAIFRALV